MATVNFIRNTKQSGSAMGATIRYVERDDKTMNGRYVSGQNCTPQLAEQEFLATRAVNRKDGGRWFYHYTQSFSPQENVTPELAQEFAAQAWPESEVVIATHVDAAHIHSHFVVNAVCFETGKMLRQHPRHAPKASLNLGQAVAWRMGCPCCRDSRTRLTESPRGSTVRRTRARAGSSSSWRRWTTA